MFYKNARIFGGDFRFHMGAFEVVDGKWILSYAPKKKLPLEDFLRPQRRFKHLFKPGNEELLVAFQAEVDKRWEELQKKCE